METIKKRPILVWIICTLYLISAFVIIQTLMHHPKNLNLTAPECGVHALIFIGYSAAALLLFLLRRQALVLYAGTSALTLADTLWHVFSHPEVGNTELMHLLGDIITLTVPLFICFYIWKLKKAGILQ